MWFVFFVFNIGENKSVFPNNHREYYTAENRYNAEKQYYNKF